MFDIQCTTRNPRQVVLEDLSQLIQQWQKYDTIK